MIPSLLKNKQNWVLWRLEARDGKLTKVPYQPTRKRASSSNPQTWSSYETVKALQHTYDGIGFCLSDDIVGIDLDHCFNDGVLSDAANEIIGRFQNTYIEISPSGDGIRIFCTGNVQRSGKGTDEKWVELYKHPSSRYLTVTENTLSPNELAECQDALDWLHEKYFSKDETQEKAKPKGDSRLSDYAVMMKARNSKKGHKFDALMSGSIGGYDSHSDADAALCSILAFWCGNDTAQIDRIFRSSGLMRDKWDEVHNGAGQTYGQMTMEFALSEKVYERRESTAKKESHKKEKPIPKIKIDFDAVPMLKKFIEFMRDSAPKPQPDLALANILPAIGVMLGGKVRTETDLRTNIYSCGISGSGRGKDYSRKIIAKLFLHIGFDNKISMKLGTGAGIVRLMADEKHRLFMHDEFGLFLHAIGKENAGKHWTEVNEVLNDFFSEANGAYHASATKGDGASIIEQPCLGLYATSTPKEFYRSLTTTMLSSGMIARLIFVPGDESAELNLEKSEKIPQELLDHWEKFSQIEPDYAPNTKIKIPIIRTVPFDDDARNAWNDFRLRMDALVRNDSNDYASIYNRAGEHAAKIALCASCFELHKAITLPVMQWAIMFVENAINVLIKALQENMSENIYEQQGKRILDFIRRRGGQASKTEIVRNTKWCDRRTRDAILEDLEESGELYLFEETAQGTHKKVNIYSVIDD